MNSENEFPQGVSQDSHPQPLSAFQRIIGIFTAPQQTFADIVQRPNWMVPFILLVVITAVAAQLMVPAIIADYQSSDRFDKIYAPMVEKGQITEEQAEQFKEAGLNNIRNFSAIFAGGGTILVCLIAAAVLLFIGNIIFGGTAKFAQIFSIYCWGGLVAVLGTILRTPLAMQKLSTKVYFSPAAFFPDSAEKTILFKIAGALDVFTIWRVVLLAVGFTALYRFTLGKSLAVLGGVYILMVAASFLVPGFF